MVHRYLLINIRIGGGDINRVTACMRGFQHYGCKYGREWFVLRSMGNAEHPNGLVATGGCLLLEAGLRYVPEEYVILFSDGPGSAVRGRRDR